MITAQTSRHVAIWLVLTLALGTAGCARSNAPVRVRTPAFLAGRWVPGLEAQGVTVIGLVNEADRAVAVRGHLVVEREAADGSARGRIFVAPTIDNRVGLFAAFADGHSPVAIIDGVGYLAGAREYVLRAWDGREVRRIALPVSTAEVVGSPLGTRLAVRSTSQPLFMVPGATLYVVNIGEQPRSDLAPILRGPAWSFPAWLSDEVLAADVADAVKADPETRSVLRTGLGSPIWRGHRLVRVSPGGNRLLGVRYDSASDGELLEVSDVRRKMKTAWVRLPNGDPFGRPPLWLDNDRLCIPVGSELVVLRVSASR